MIERIHIAGCPVDRISLIELIELLFDAIRNRKSCQVLGVNAAFVVCSNRSKKFRENLESTTYLPIDGFWVAFAGKILGFKDVEHVGIERFVYKYLDLLADKRCTVYLLGAREHIVDKAAEEILKRYKGISIVGVRNGYFNETEEEDILFNINNKNPDLILVGMGSPKREYWMSKYRDRIKSPVIIGVGGLFDVVAGEVPPASDWIKNHGLEWIFRFYHDPRRLWRRYLFDNPFFIWLVLNEIIRKKLFTRQT